jgi:hypothetical protein
MFHPNWCGPSLSRGLKHGLPPKAEVPIKGTRQDLDTLFISSVSFGEFSGPFLVCAPSD